VIDWAPQSCTDETQGNLLALALYDTIYLLDPLKKGSAMKQIEFNEGRQNNSFDENPVVQCLSFDRCGEAFAAGSTENLVSIFDVERSKRIRNLKCHSDMISSLSWNRSFSMPYLLITGSKDKTIVLHDVRQRISQIT
jgi:WD40 repeat protein